MEEAVSPGFWLALLEIITINIVLSGDNALVIALACRGLPPKNRRWGIALGTLAAIVLRIIFAVVIVFLLRVPLLMLAGSALLMWIAIKLVLPEKSEHEAGIAASASIWQAVWVVMVADAVMSLDNVIAVAAAAKGSLLLLILGITISIPPVVLGAAIMLYVLDRFPILVIAGSGLLGWVAGELAVEDEIAHAFLTAHAPLLISSAPFICCAIVVAVGLWATANQGRPAPRELLPLDGDGEGNR
jgi:YjbE family integral membrane protein